MVTAWNELFIKKGESTPRTLTMADLTPVLTPDFFRSAGYYFEGVWSNVTEGEQNIMRILSERKRTDKPWSHKELAEAASMDSERLEDILKLLRRHDVIVEEKNNKDKKYIRFASEIMRRWVESFAGEKKEVKSKNAK